jgi:hypothetical protein
MIILGLLVFAGTLGLIAFGASKASKAAKKAKYKQDIELIEEIYRNRNK